jgi:hypothetical protein
MLDAHPMRCTRLDAVPPTPSIFESTGRLDRQQAVPWGALSAGHVGADQPEATSRQRAECLGIVSLVVHMDRVRPGSDRERSSFQLRVG